MRYGLPWARKDIVDGSYLLFEDTDNPIDDKIEVFRPVLSRKLDQDICEGVVNLTSFIKK